MMAARWLPVMMWLIATAAGAGQAPGFAGTYWSDSERGWHWYEDPPKTSPKTRPTPAPAKPKPAESSPELTAFAALQKQLEDAQRIAFMQPTEDNVRRYLDLQALVVDKSSRFADVWQRVIWATPDLDYTVTGRPVNARALDVFNAQTQRNRATSVAALAKSHVLFFFFRGDCAYCHAFAPYLREFEAKFGLQVEGISLDGGTLPAFPRPRIDNGISRTLDVKHVPALYLADPASGRITPIGFGVLSESELLERLDVVSRPEAAGMLPSASKRMNVR
ncbi:conjugal transfer protein TraF [Actimicrobium sp. CCI2.3]|uniref:conjugal transfer protein TraF n=1 Tax=Actimicrobium sp. CCI2.3 TaxID=3048616 RepID=UPI002AB34DFB|nr:conjugal transfer protein TraF [Actimicrobium sp. CCI2.3]MDY7574450.1 conjugal transfer protein TraF [Actimicrobium sp. CCI2.3]MEB0022472.1 conjugal transfer protein TraF [Actimicrobium sp. CCI2.3]